MPRSQATDNGIRLVDFAFHAKQLKQSYVYRQRVGIFFNALLQDLFRLLVFQPHPIKTRETDVTLSVMRVDLDSLPQVPLGRFVLLQCALDQREVVIGACFIGEQHHQFLECLQSILGFTHAQKAGAF